MTESSAGMSPRQGELSDPSSEHGRVANPGPTGIITSPSEATLGSSRGRTMLPYERGAPVGAGGGRSGSRRRASPR